KCRKIQVHPCQPHLSRRYWQPELTELWCPRFRRRRLSFCRIKRFASLVSKDGDSDDRLLAESALKSAPGTLRVGLGLVPHAISPGVNLGCFQKQNANISYRSKSSQNVLSLICCIEKRRST